jgi:hypothetical protein
MNEKQRIQLRKNARLINKLTKRRKYANMVSSDAETNMKGALIGGGVGVLIAIATKQNLVIGGILGLIVGRFIFKVD